MRLLLIVTAVLFLPAIALSQTTYYVPDDYPTIQGAIDASSNGDTIVVRAGLYFENIDFVGKAIHLKSEMGPEVTVIDGGNPSNPDFGSVVTFQSGEAADSILDGFTLTNGSGTGSGWTYGGGIYCRDNSSPIITNNTITANSVIYAGGGIYYYSSSPTITNNTFSGNTASFGGGISCEFAHYSAIENNRIIGNSADDGGGLHIWYYSSPTIMNNTILGNSADSGGGIYILENSEPTVKNTILWGNEFDEIHVSGGCAVTVRYSDIKGGWSGAGNIDANPLFADPGIYDFHLTWGSPCRDAGKNFPTIPTEDFEGDPRIANGTADMGADEFWFHLYHAGNVVPGGQIDVRVVGIPSFRVTLAQGSGVLDPPWSTQYGDLYLEPPIVNDWKIGSIPPTGVLIRPMTVPLSWAPGKDYPFQAQVGYCGGHLTSLTNLMVLGVE